MSNKENFIYKIITLSLFIFLVISGFYMYEIRNSIENADKFDLQVAELSFLNKNIDLIIKGPMNYINYDSLVLKVKTAEEILKNLKNNPKFQKILSNKDTKESYQLIKKGFSDKDKIVNRFNSSNAILNNSLRMISFYLKIINQEDRKGNFSNLFTDFHYSLLQLELGLDVEAISAKIELIKKIQEKDKTKNMKLYFKHSFIVLENYHIMKNLMKENQELKLSVTIDGLRAKTKEYIDKLFEAVYSILLASFALLFIMILIVINLIVSIRKNTIEMAWWKQAVEQSDNSLLITDKDYKINYVNKTFIDIFGYEESEVLGKSPSILKSGVHDDEFFKVFEETIASGQTWTGEFVNKRKDGLLVYMRSSVSPIFDLKNKIIGYMSIELDISEEKKYIKNIEEKNRENKLRYETDALTGVGSQRALMDRLFRKEKGILVYINIDQFSDIRFFLGTEHSSRVIVALAEILKTFIETYNLKSNIYRIQTDEFCIWFDDIEFDEKSLDYVREYVNFHPIYIENTPQNISVKMGISLDKDTGKSDRLLQAILAHNEAKVKELFKNKYVPDNIIEKQYAYRIAMTKSIRHALSEDSVIVQCQGIFDATTRIATNYEILMRIKDEEGKIRYPGEFLDIAKKTSLYTPLTHQVIKIAFELLERFPENCFSINLSSIDISNKATRSWFLECLRKCINPEHLTVEILESEGIDDYECIIPFVQNIKEYGCRLAIDDFGSGYSNYYRILQLDIDYLKIDGSIIKNLPYDKNAQSVVETIVDFTKKQGYGVVAEFVSDEKILEAVQKYGINMVQGFYLGKPVDIDKL